MSKATFYPPDGKLWVIPDPPQAIVRGVHIPQARGGQKLPDKRLTGMATVKAMGEGPFSQDGSRRLPMPCKVGDRVLVFFQQQNFFCPEDLVHDMCIVDHDQIMAVVEGIPAPETNEISEILKSN